MTPEHLEGMSDETPPWPVPPGIATRPDFLSGRKKPDDTTSSLDWDAYIYGLEMRKRDNAIALHLLLVQWEEWGSAFVVPEDGWPLLDKTRALLTKIHGAADV
jgi:hypothetical protein